MPDANQPQWIAFADHSPTQSDFPAWLYCSSGKWSEATNLRMAESIHDRFRTIYSDATHWMKATLPAPPPLSRDEEDSDAYDAWLSAEAKKLPIGVFRLCDSWHAALAWDRAEICKTLDAFGKYQNTQSAESVLADLRARCAPRP